MTLDFLNEAANVVLVGPNGVGKSTIAAKYRPPRRVGRPHRALRNRRQPARRARHYRLRQPAPAQAPLLRPPAAPGDRRGRIPVLQQPPCRSAVQYRLQPLAKPFHHNHHQPPLRRVGRGIPKRRLPRRPGRPPSSTTPRSSPSMAIPIVQRRPSSDRRSAQPNVGGGGAVHGLPPENRRRQPADQPIETARQYRG